MFLLDHGDIIWKDFCLSIRDCAVQIYKLYHDVGRTVFSGGFVSCLALILFVVVWSCGFFKSSPSKLSFATWNIFCKNHMHYVMQQRIIYFYIWKIGLKMNVNSHQLSVGGSADSDVWTRACRPFWHFPTMHLGLSCGAWVHGMTWGWTMTNMNWKYMLFFMRWI